MTFLEKKVLFSNFLLQKNSFTKILEESIK